MQRFLLIVALHGCVQQPSPVSRQVPTTPSASASNSELRAQIAEALAPLKQAAAEYRQSVEAQEPANHDVEKLAEGVEALTPEGVEDKMATGEFAAASSRLASLRDELKSQQGKEDERVAQLLFGGLFVFLGGLGLYQMGSAATRGRYHLLGTWGRIEIYLAAGLSLAVTALGALYVSDQDDSTVALGLVMAVVGGFAATTVASFYSLGFTDKKYRKHRVRLELLEISEELKRSGSLNYDGKIYKMNAITDADRIELSHRVKENLKTDSAKYRSGLRNFRTNNLFNAALGGVVTAYVGYKTYRVLEGNTGTSLTNPHPPVHELFISSYRFFDKMLALEHQWMRTTERK